MIVVDRCAPVVSGTTSTDNEVGGKQSLLLRWFESKLFDMSFAVMYLFNSKETGVQTYIGNRIFSYPIRDVDFYLQQLVNMYIHMHDVAEVVHPYLVDVFFHSVKYQIVSSIHPIIRFIVVVNQWIFHCNVPGC